MVDLFTQCDPDYGRRVDEGLKAARQATEKQNAQRETQSV